MTETLQQKIDSIFMTRGKGSNRQDRVNKALQEFREAIEAYTCPICEGRGEETSGYHVISKKDVLALLGTKDSL